MAQQTAVQFLLENIHLLHSLKWNDVIEQAKEIEKEQSMQDYDSGLFDGTMDDVNDRLYKNAEQYYNETYNK